MKIGLVLSTPPAYSETFFITKMKGLQAAGYEVILLVQNNSKSFHLCKTVKGPNVYKRPWRTFLMSIYLFFTLLPYYKVLLRFIGLERKAQRRPTQIFKNIYTNAHLLTSKVDWLHFGFATMGLQSEHVAKAIGAKMAVSCRGYDMDIYPLKHPNCYTLLWQSVDKVHAISQYMLKKAYETGLSKQTSTQVITPAIAISKFNAKPPKAGPSSPLRFVTIARLHWIKGLMDTLEGLSILKQEGLGFHYRIIGSGPDYEPLMFAIHQLDLQANVQLLGQQSPEAIIDVLNEADVYLQYSLSEGFCNAVLEAQAMGLLCVVSDGGGLQENVLHQTTGIVVAKGRPKELAKAIKNLLHLPLKEQQAMRQAAQERVRSIFNLDLQKRQFVDFYND